jgi:hypothetical protein
LPACENPIVGTECLTTALLPSLMSCTKISIGVPVAASDFATDSVEGQRA